MDVPPPAFDFVTNKGPAAPITHLPWANFGLRLREARVAAGLSQAAVAERCQKKGNSWISQLEDGAFPRSLDDVALLAAALGVSSLWLLTGIGHAGDVAGGEEAALKVIGSPDDSVKALLPRDIPQLVGASAKRHFLLWAEALVNPIEAPIRHGILLCELKERPIPGQMPAVILGRRGYCYEAGQRASPGRTGHVVVGMFAAPTKRWRPG